MTVLAITNSFNSKLELIECKTKDEALDKMKSLYKKKCQRKKYDVNNTYLDEDDCYAQIVNGLEQVEFRIGNI